MLFAEKGTELKISPLLEGIRTLSGEKIQWYLASELRDRIRDSKARVTVIDKLARKQYEVEPRQFEGRLLHQLPPIRTLFGDAYAELYLAEPDETARVALTRVGTRVIEDLSTLSRAWSIPRGSRATSRGSSTCPSSISRPARAAASFKMSAMRPSIDALKPLEAHVKALIEEQQRAEEEQASQQSLKAIQKAFHEAMLALPREEYDWFDVQAPCPSARQLRQRRGAAACRPAPTGTRCCRACRSRNRTSRRSGSSSITQVRCLVSVVSPAASTTPLNETREDFGRCRAIARAGA